MKRRTLIRIFSFSAAAFVIASGFAIQFRQEADTYSRLLRYEQTRSMTDLTESMNDISQALTKGRCAYTPELLAAISAEIWQETEAARSALSRLQETSVPLDNTCRFIAQAGDYAFCLLKRAASGQAITTEERASLTSLSEAARSYAEALSVMSAEADAGVLRFDTESAEQRTIAGEMSSLEEEFPEYATLIYDGPLSDHIDRLNPTMTTNAPTVTQAEALTNLAAVCGCPAEAFTACSLQEGKLPAYCFTGECAGERICGTVTREGGYVLSFLRSRDRIDPTMTAEEGVTAAKALAERLAFANLQETYYWNDAGLVVVNLAAEQDGVTLYPDLVKVGVSLDDGTLLRLETRGYLMNHCDRLIAEPKISSESVRKDLGAVLTVETESLALIPTDGGDEVLCRELLCHADDGTRMLVYCDAATGAQRQLLILVEDENGTLTV